MVRRRATGTPLQYVLGSQPFGALDVLPDTEAYALQAAALVARAINGGGGDESAPPRSLRVLDLCTGTGCIPLLLHAQLAPVAAARRARLRLRLHAVDTDRRALRLVRENVAHNVGAGALRRSARADIAVHQADVFALAADAVLPAWLAPAAAPDDLLILTANPPYISPRAYTDGTTARGVRLHEPKTALVPPARAAAPDSFDFSDALAEDEEDPALRQADAFYAPLLRLAKRLGAQLAVLECGDAAQAARVVRAAWRVLGGRWDEIAIEVWRCDGAGRPIRHAGQDGGLAERWCSLAADSGVDYDGGGQADDGDGGSGGARVVVVRRPPFI
ncbi:hypothetical protein KEM52_003653 [Ascosphaera acerosa]|nr:hypothetical protein KEM52_003653 [Ascosphaera acerosa]